MRKSALEGAAAGAPLAVQVADRWHLLHNLAEAVERATARHRSCLQEQPAPPGPGAPPATSAPDGPRVLRTRARHAEIHAALGCGLTVTEISRALRLDRKTVRRYASAASPDELSADAPAARASLLDPHLPYLHKRWEEGCRSTDMLHQEIRGRGYRGSLRTLRRHTAQLRQATARPAPPPAPASKKVASWILTPPGKLTDTDHAALAKITARCQELTITCALVREFADMLCHRKGSRLGAWAASAEASPVPELRGFAKGLRKDQDAVTAGLTLPYSSGAVEGNVNRIILWNQIVRVCSGSAVADGDDREQPARAGRGELAWCRPGRGGRVCELGQEAADRGLAVIDGSPLIVGERDRGGHLLQVALGFQQLGRGGVLRGVEVAAGAGHPVRALLEERVGAIPVPEVVVLPWLAGSSCSGGDGVAVDEDFDSPDVAGEVPGVGVSPGERLGADLRVELR